MRCELRPNTRVETLPLADRYHVPHPTVDLADPEARVTVREHAGAAAIEVPRSAWRFPDPGHIELRGGFTPGSIYDVIYRSAAPPLLGLGFLAVRDTAAWLRWAPAAENSTCALGSLRCTPGRRWKVFPPLTTTSCSNGSGSASSSMAPVARLGPVHEQGLHIIEPGAS